MFCPNCGKKVPENAKFCPNCSEKVSVKMNTTKKPAVVPFLNRFMALNLSMRGIIALVALGLITAIIYGVMSASLIGWILVVLVFIISIFLQYKFTGNNFNKVVGLVVIPVVLAIIILPTTNGLNNVSIGKIGKVSTVSSVVSQGVNLDDLGNVVNGQFFFDDGTNQFYSTFDTKGESHIYVTNKKSGSTKSIFDGFGWSFVMHDGWLYFSGNQGTEIDDTYNLFRMKADGSKLEKINTSYCYNMNFYKQWLYYIRLSDSEDTNSAVYRSQIDGSGEEEVISVTSGLSVIYENKLYYSDEAGYIYEASPDGTNKKLLIDDETNYFVIGQGKLIYIDSAYNIKSAKIDGTDIKTIRATDGEKISKVNSYKGTVYYIRYNPTYVEARDAYQYSIYSVKMDGTDNKKVYDGVSWGYYVNILNNKIFALDYAQELSIDMFTAITRNMDLNGNNIKDLYRK